MRFMVFLMLAVLIASCSKPQRQPAFAAPPPRSERQSNELPGPPPIIHYFIGTPLIEASKQILLRSFSGASGFQPGQEILSSAYIELTEQTSNIDEVKEVFKRSDATRFSIGCGGAADAQIPNSIKADTVEICGKVNLTKVQTVRARTLILNTAQVFMTDDVIGPFMVMFTEELVLRGANTVEMKAVAERESSRSLHFSFMFLSENGTLQIIARGKDGRGVK